MIIEKHVANLEVLTGLLYENAGDLVNARNLAVAIADAANALKRDAEKLQSEQTAELYNVAALPLYADSGLRFHKYTAR